MTDRVEAAPRFVLVDANGRYVMGGTTDAERARIEAWRAVHGAVDDHFIEGEAGRAAWRAMLARSRAPVPA